MAYSRKYTISYKRFSNNTTTIDILEKDTAYGSPTEFTGADQPFIVSVSGDVNNIYEPTIGSGATLSFNVTPLSTLDLFTTDPQKYIIKAYHGTSGTGLFWQGFLNTGIYNEDYSASSDIQVPITLYANDGMNVLDSLYYKESNGDFYTGDVTIGSILNTVLGKLGLTFDKVYTSLDLTVTNTYTTNLFNNLLVNNQNHIDESLEAMTCREVLNSIFGGLGFVMRFYEDDIYIYDPINLHDTGNGKVYALPAFTESSSSVGGYIDISGYYETGQTLDIVPKINSASVKYDPYNLTDFNYDFDDLDNHSTKGSFSGQGSPILWYLNHTVVFKDWTQSGTLPPEGSHFIGVEETEEDTPVYAVYLSNSSGTVTYTIPHSNIHPDGTTSIRISFDGYANTKDYNTNLYDITATNELNKYEIKCSIKVGDLYWKDTLTSWEAGQDGDEKIVFNARQEGVSSAQYYDNPSNSRVDNTWTTMLRTIPIVDISGGSIEFSIYDSWDRYMMHPDNYYLIMKRLFIKNLTFEFIDSTGKVLGNAGIETKGSLIADAIYKSDNTEISTTNGIGPYGTSRGTFLMINTNGQYIIVPGLYRSGVAYLTEKLILQSFISQYKQSRFKLTANLNVKDSLLNTSLKLIQDSDYLPDIAFYITTFNYNDRDESMQIEAIELTDTRESL